MFFLHACIQKGFKLTHLNIPTERYVDDLNILPFISISGEGG